MNTAILSAVPADAARMPPGRVLGAYLAEARSECLRYLRNPAFMLPILLFPGLIYLVFAVLIGKSQGPEAARYLLASYGVFGVMSPGLFGFGVSLALERDGGLLTLKRALPMPPGAYLLGKMLMAMGAAALVMLMLLAMATGLAHVVLAPAQAAMLVATGIFGVLPFCALGMLVGTWVKGQGAPGMLQLVYMPMSILSGLWFPLSMFPRFFQRLAPIWPSYHLARIAQTAVGLAHAAIWPHVLVLVIFGVACFALAARRLRRNG